MHSGLFGYVLPCLMMFIEWGEDTSTVVPLLSYNILEGQWAPGPQYKIYTLISTMCFHFQSPI